uniref:SAM domain-containing protein n=1 Tax=Ditylum brightwellii TaxID=49249 RepID=A0A7S4VV32_9STRA
MQTFFQSSDHTYNKTRTVQEVMFNFDPSTAAAGGPASPTDDGSTKLGTLATPYSVTSERNGLTTIYIQAITAMPQYEAKSFEELRFEDYQAGNKGSMWQSCAAAPATGDLGNGGIFGAPAPAPAFCAPAPAFGVPAPAPPPAAGGFSYGGFPKTKFGSSTPTPGFSFGRTKMDAAPAPAAGGFRFEGSATTPAKDSKLNTSAPAAGGFSFGGTSTTTTAIPAKDSKPAAPPALAAGGFSFGGSVAAPGPAISEKKSKATASATPASAVGGFSLDGAASTTANNKDAYPSSKSSFNIPVTTKMSSQRPPTQVMSPQQQSPLTSTTLEVNCGQTVQSQLPQTMQLLQSKFPGGNFVPVATEVVRVENAQVSQSPTPMHASDNLKNATPEQICQWLSKRGVSKASIDVLQREEIDGTFFFEESIGDVRNILRGEGIKLGQISKIVSSVEDAKRAGSLIF